MLQSASHIPLLADVLLLVYILITELMITAYDSMRHGLLNDLNSAQHVSNIMLLWVDSAFWNENADKVIDRINESFASRAEAVSLGGNYVLILLCENHYSRLSYMAEGIYYMLTEVYGQQCYLAVGAGMNDIYEIHDSCQRLLKLMENRFFADNNGIYYEDDD